MCFFFYAYDLKYLSTMLQNNVLFVCLYVYANKKWLKLAQFYKSQQKQHSYLFRYINMAATRSSSLENLRGGVVFPVILRRVMIHP